MTLDYLLDVCYYLELITGGRRYDQNENVDHVVNGKLRLSNSNRFNQNILETSMLGQGRRFVRISSFEVILEISNKYWSNKGCLAAKL